MKPRSRFKDECDQCHEFHVLTNHDGKLLCDKCAEKQVEHTHSEQLKFSLFNTLFDV